MQSPRAFTFNDNERGLIQDMDQWLEKLTPFNPNYRHYQTGEDKGDSHRKALLIHHEVIAPITAGKLDLGLWQRIFMRGSMDNGTSE